MFLPSLPQCLDLHSSFTQATHIHLPAKVAISLSPTHRRAPAGKQLPTLRLAPCRHDPTQTLPAESERTAIDIDTAPCDLAALIAHRGRKHLGLLTMMRSIS